MKLPYSTRIMRLIIIKLGLLAFSGLGHGLKENTPWWLNSILYQIYPRSFKDSNGDGVGDLKGIESKLSYLKDEIQVDAIWLSPIYSSPMKDFGYDVSNYTDVDPIFGTVDDLRSFISSCHDVGLKVVLDFIPNHSSNEHDWFKKSVMRMDPFTDFYVWLDPQGFDHNGEPIPPNNWLSAFRGSAWTYNEQRGQFYLHQYLAEQPDLNYRNPELFEEMKNAMRFWLEAGVDGFRMDAVTKIWEDDRWLDEPIDPDSDAVDTDDYAYLEHIYTLDQPGTKKVLKEFYDLVKSYGEDRVMMLELSALEDVDRQMKYYECSDFPFNFNLMWLEPPLTAEKVADAVMTWISSMPERAIPNFVLGNHDFARVGTKFGTDLIDTLNIINLGLPGISITYQGEEIGMTDNMNISYFETQDPKGCNCGPERYQECSRDPVRTPFQWSYDPNAGFSTPEAEPWLPINSNYLDYNVQGESGVFTSHLEVYKTASVMRKDFFPVIYVRSKVFDNNVWAFHGGFYVVVANFEDSNNTVDLLHVFHPTKPQAIVFNSSKGPSGVTPPGTIVDLKNIQLGSHEAIAMWLIPQQI